MGKGIFWVNGSVKLGKLYFKCTVVSGNVLWVSDFGKQFVGGMFCMVGY